MEESSRLVDVLRDYNSTHGHTNLDYQHLVNPEKVEPRHRAVHCIQCLASTWNLRAYCDRHYVIGLNQIAGEAMLDRWSKEPLRSAIDLPPWPTS